jgi:cytochrome b561
MAPTSTLQPTTRPWQYSFVAKALHWGIGTILAVMVGLGWYMTEIESDPGAPWFFGLHQSIGLILAGAIVLRIIWRLTHKPQRLPEHIAGWQARLAQITQLAMYALIVLIPATGIIGSLLSEDGITFLGSELARLIPANHDLAEQVFSVHGALIWVLIGLVTVHVAGALKHLLIDKDGVFQRMF